MEAVLACPACGSLLEIRLFKKGPGGWEEGGSTCSACGAEYKLSGGIWDLTGMAALRHERDGRRWAAEDFEHLQPGNRDYRSHAEWLQLRLGFSPSAATTLATYQEPLRKGRLGRWLAQETWDVLLDVGCGVGYFLFDVLESLRDNRLMIGLDVSRSVLHRLVRRRREEGTSAVLAVLGSAEQLPLRDATMGAVSSSEVLEHVAHPDKALQEMARVVRPGGPIVASTPNARGEALRDGVAALLERAKVLNRSSESRIYWEELYDVPLTDTWFTKHLAVAGLELETLLYAHRVPGAARIARALPFAITSTALRTLERLLPGRSLGMIMVFRARRREQPGPLIRGRRLC
jgi:ubiquinone/menaquinone biosynthesis C-methylase UbiE